MAYRRLFILVEGPDDERFTARVIRPLLEQKHESVEVLMYAGWTSRKLDSFLRNLTRAGWTYLYLADMNASPCVTAKKTGLQRKLNNLEEDKIIVVIREIEAWFLAGLSDADAKELCITAFQTTDAITKEDFNRLIPEKFSSRIDFMLEILKSFSSEVARQKNQSFRYFVEKHDC